MLPSAAAPSWRIKLYEFIAAPAHAWMLICAAVVGIHLDFGPIDSGRGKASRPHR
jgi:hypothetical protein